MAQDDPYVCMIVESYVSKATSGLHGKVHIRPVQENGYSTNLHVSCSKKLSEKFPVGTKFRIRATLTDRKSGGEYLFSSPKWSYEVL